MQQSRWRLRRQSLDAGSFTNNTTQCKPILYGPGEDIDITIDGRFTVEVPYNIEVVPFGYSDYNLWANDEMTKEYKYPGDGIDYTVCYTNIMG